MLRSLLSQKLAVTCGEVFEVKCIHAREKEQSEETIHLNTYLLFSWGHRHVCTFCCIRVKEREGREGGRETETQRDRDRDTDRDRERQKGEHRQRPRETETETQRSRQTETEREIDTETQRKNLSSSIKT